jgi:protein-disulfide isomerase
MKRSVALLAALTLGLAGCGNGGETDKEAGDDGRPAVLAWMEEGLSTDGLLSDAEARCLTDAVEDLVDPDQLAEASGEDESLVIERSSQREFDFLDLDAEQADALADAADECGAPLVEVAETGSDRAPGVADGEDDSVAAEISEFGVVIGDPSAETTVIIYEDLQCPACAGFEALVGEPLDQAIDEGRVRVDYRMVAFINDHSVNAMNALLVVLEESGADSFRDLHATLFIHQPRETNGEMDADDLVALAVEAGADEDAVRAGIEDVVHEGWIEAATDQMSEDGVASTPTVLVDGQEATPEELLEMLGQ